MDHAMNVAARNTAAEDEFISDGYDIERRLCRKSRQKKNEKKTDALSYCDRSSVPA